MWSEDLETSSPFRGQLDEEPTTRELRRIELAVPIAIQELVVTASLGVDRQAVGAGKHVAGRIRKCCDSATGCLSPCLHGAEADPDQNREG